jgi:hypothetical protein
MSTGAYLDATKAYANADEIKVTREAAFHRARSFTALSMLPSALEDFKKVKNMMSSP